VQSRQVAVPAGPSVDVAGPDEGEEEDGNLIVGKVGRVC